MLQETFTTLLLQYTDDSHLIQHAWIEIEQSYTHKKRHYHTLAHLENILQHLLDVKDFIQDWNTTLFTLFYHDCIYNALASDNEEKSAELAVKRMQQFNVPVPIIENCKAQILATKKHLEISNLDTNYFIDADLCVLGQDIETYTSYYKNVRKEYSMYPDLIYNLGRRKVLNHFLEMVRIYKTDYFFHKFELQAKQNLKFERSKL